MPKPLPKLDLSLGQVAWTISLGRPPEQRLLDQIRYFRQLGIPFDESESGFGRGKSVRFHFDDLIELGLAIFALRRGISPKDIVGLLVGQRKQLRPLYRRAYLEQPESALDAEWVKSRGQSIPVLAKECFVRLHDRFSETPGKIERMTQAEVGHPSEFFSLVERYPGERARSLLPLTRLVLEWTAWAQIAPDTRPGPKTRLRRD
jgi:hypothetical protein